MSMIKQGLLRLALVVPATAFSVTAQAQAYGAFNQDTIYGTLQKGQRDSFDSAVTQVLNDPHSSKALDWKSDAQTGNAGVSGHLQADDAPGQNGMACRNLHAALSRGTAHEKWIFLFCKRSDGQWRVASQARQ